MNRKKVLLVEQIHHEFQSVPFPLHCGLHAAVAKDDWISDKIVLKKITQNQDFIGKWWDVPEKHLVECMMALDYLDGKGMEFYLPSYMTLLVKKPIAFDVPHVKSSSWQVLYTMLPPDGIDQDLVAHFKEQFSRIVGGKRMVCIQFMDYVSKCESYDHHARKIAKEALDHEFWAVL